MEETTKVEITTWDQYLELNWTAFNKTIRQLSPKDDLQLCQWRQFIITDMINRHNQESAAFTPAEEKKEVIEDAIPAVD